MPEKARTHHDPASEQRTAARSHSASRAPAMIPASANASALLNSELWCFAAVEWTHTQLFSASVIMR